MTTALVVVDLQNDFADPSGSLYVRQAELVVPVVNAEISEAVHDGATLVCGGRPGDGPGHFYPPTVLVGIPAEAQINSVEIFGPVAPITTFTTEDEAV